MYFNFLLSTVAAAISVVGIVEAKAVFAHYMVFLTSLKMNLGKSIYR